MAAAIVATAAAAGATTKKIDNDNAAIDAGNDDADEKKGLTDEERTRRARDPTRKEVKSAICIIPPGMHPSSPLLPRMCELMKCTWFG